MHHALAGIAAAALALTLNMVSRVTVSAVRDLRHAGNRRDRLRRYRPAALVDVRARDRRRAAQHRLGILSAAHRMNWPLIWLLLRVITPLSFVTIGGGASIIADLERQSVTRASLADGGAVSRISSQSRAPRRDRDRCLLRSSDFVSTAWSERSSHRSPFSCRLRSILYVLARIWRHYRDASWQHAVERGLAPVAAGLILAGVYSILRIAEGGIMAWIVAIAAFVALRWLRANPFALLALGGVIFAIVGIYWWPT